MAENVLTDNSDNEELFCNKSLEFAINLYNEIIKKQPGKNIIFSPFSIQMCISLAYLGAKNDTAEEIKTSLNLGSFNEDEIKEIYENIMNKFVNNNVLTIANKIYVDQKYELNENYSNDIQKYLHSEIEKIDFSKSIISANQINVWVENKTKKKIRNLISPDVLAPNTAAVLVNAIHFKCGWKKKFNEHHTTEDKFWIKENKSIIVSMMTDKDDYDYAEIEELDATAIQLPYNKSDLSLMIILPNRREGLRALEDKLRDFNLLEIRNYMHFEEVYVKIPKFEIEFEIELSEPLKNLGMRKMFTNEADFGNILKSDEPIKISKVIHKAYIEVNEEGTEAAAATGAHFVRCAGPLKHGSLPIIFYANRPFIYIIKTGKSSIHFMGRYLGSDNN